MMQPVEEPISLKNYQVDERSTLGCFTECLNDYFEMTMIQIPSGQFWMGTADDDLQGSGDERSQRLVQISGFWLGQHAITQSQWSEVAALPEVDRMLDPFPSMFRGVNLPVENVSWYDAVEFCRRLSLATGRTYRLPSEAEWEYACRAGTTTLYSFGDTISDEQANCDFEKAMVVKEGLMGLGRKTTRKGCYREKTTTVGSFSPNSWGLYDMHGNVSEWCADHWHANYDDGPIDGSVWQSLDESAPRVCRGGSWLRYPGGCRSAYRDYDAPAIRSSFTGFRVVCTDARI